VQVDDGSGGTYNQTFNFNVNLYSGSFVGSNGREMVIGTVADDTMNGGGNVDYMFGGAGNDTLNGEGSYDVLEGGAGADILNGGVAGDTASYYYSEASVTADLANTTLNTGDAAGDVYISIENLRGSQFDDMLYGDAADNWIFGFDGNDMITGRGGNDTLFGGAGNDEFVFEDGSGNDGIYDFVAGAGTEDTLNIQAFGFTDFTAVQAAAFIGADGCVVIQLDADDSVELHGINSIASLHQNDFII
jgi:Ca2+-binding RTX toxin-like protein